MSDITRQDLQDLTLAMSGGFQSVQDHLDAAQRERAQIRNVLDRIAGRVDGLWTENAAQASANRRIELRVERIEQHLDLPVVD